MTWRLHTPSLLDAIEQAERKTEYSIGVSAENGIALRLPLTAGLRSLLEEASVSKRVHDLKLALHVLHGFGIQVRGRR